MADTKISALTDGGSSRNTDYVPAVRSGANVKVTVGPSDYQPPIVTGNYYSGQGTVPSGATNWISDTIVSVPMWFSFSETWTRIGVNVTTDEPGANIRLGIWENGADNQPAGLILDTGNLSLSSIGDVSATISQMLAGNTVYWVGAVSDTNGTAVLVSSYFTGEMAARLGHSSGFADGITGGVRKGIAFGALPNPFGAPDGYTDSGPLIWLRRV
jgi:hypothetical protein